MDIQEGIKIYIENKSNAERRIQISSGTALAGNLANCKNSHFEDAFIPLAPWRYPLPDEEDLLMTKEPLPNENLCVGVLQIPATIMDLFSKVEFSSLPLGRTETLDNTYYREGLLELLEFLTPICEKEKTQIYGILINPPNLMTTSLAPNFNKYIGLHLDNWDRLTIVERHNATNRISINLSNEPRYFLFINITAQEMYKLLNDNILDNKKFDNGKLIGDEFMKAYPSYPVIKCRLDPGEAYIASTENMIHDGCTSGNEYKDISLVIRGQFHIPG